MLNIESEHTNAANIKKSEVSAISVLLTDILAAFSQLKML